MIIRYSGYPRADFEESGGRQNKKNEKDPKIGCVREGKVGAGVLKVHICYINLDSEAPNVYFKMTLSFYYLVGPLFLESAEKRTELSKKCGLMMKYFHKGLFGQC